MQYLILGIFLINTGITCALVAVFRYEADRNLAKLEERHFSLILDLARQQGRSMANIKILEDSNATR